MSPGPMMAGLAELNLREWTLSSPDKAVRNTSYSVAISRCRSIAELVSCCSIAYRPYIQRELSLLSTTARKHAECSEALVKLRSYKERNVVPPFLTGYAKPPVYDLTSHAGAVQGRLQKKLLEDAKTRSRLFLDTVILYREEELSELSKAMSYASYTKRFTDTLAKAKNTVITAHGLKQTDLVTQEPMRTIVTDHKFMSEVAPELGRRCIELHHSAAVSRSNKWEKKVAILDESQKMQVDPPVLNRQTIEQIVKKALSKKVTSPKDRLIEDKKGQKRRFKETGRGCSKRQRTETTVQGNEDHYYNSKAGSYSPSAEKIGPHDSSEPWAKQEEKINLLLGDSWVWNKPSTYPDLITEINLPDAITCIMWKTPVEVLEFNRTRANVHIQEGLVVPYNVIQVISSGKKFLLPITPNINLVFEAWKDFESRLRWKYYFRNQESDYDHDYYVKKQTDVLGPRSTDIIERGLERGWASLQIQLVVPGKTHFSRVPGEMRNVQSWLDSNECLVLPTDKNLGYVVVRNKWYLDRLAEFMFSPMFKEVDSYDVEKIGKGILTALNWCVQALEGCVNDLGSGITYQLQGFLMSTHRKMYSSGYSHVGGWIPQMSGIPKLKNWKLRPIVPATTHGWVLGPLAKFVSKMLKPSIRKFGTIIESSKELAKALAELKLDPEKKYVIVTADVESFYTNVPISACRDIVKENVTGSPALIQLLEQAVEYVNSYQLVKFGERTFLQRKGLAMGVGCSPDLANLYAARYEQTFANRDDVIFFCRYMDDIFIILDKSKPGELMNVLNSLVYENLTLKWSFASNYTQVVFLDMVIWLNRHDNSIGFRPYIKPLNHFERIPFDSAQPTWMKKGIFVGELTRLAYLSSEHIFYVDAVKSLQRIYSGRGYPIKLVNTWTKDYFAERWISRFDSKVKEGTPFVLKSELNPIWEGINISEVFNAMIRVWDEDPSIRDWRLKRMLLSRRKPNQLGLDTIIRVWNKNTISFGMQGPDALLRYVRPEE